MSDERVDALIRRLDVQSSPASDFVAESLAMLRPRVRAARIEDMSRIGRLRRDLGLATTLKLPPAVPRPIAIAALLALLLAAIAALGIAGALLRAGPIGNGPLVIVLRGELRAFDVDTGSSRQIVPPAENAKHVSRSPDGRRIAYWKVDPAGRSAHVHRHRWQRPPSSRDGASRGLGRLHRHLVARLAISGQRGHRRRLPSDPHRRFGDGYRSAVDAGRHGRALPPLVAGRSVGRLHRG